MIFRKITKSPCLWLVRYAIAALELISQGFKAKEMGEMAGRGALRHGGPIWRANGVCEASDWAGPLKADELSSCTWERVAAGPDQTSCMCHMAEKGVCWYCHASSSHTGLNELSRT